jgi:Ca2+ transporting ATPase
MNSIKFELSPVDINELYDNYMENPEGYQTKLAALGGIEGICESLKVNLETGIGGGPSELEARITLYGNNMKDRDPLPPFRKFLCEAISDVFIVILIIASLVQIVIGALPISEDSQKEWIDGLAILLAVILVVMTTAVTNYNKEKQFRKLADSNSKRKYSVKRGDQIIDDFDEELIVVGDIVKITNGMMIPVDGLVVTGNDISVDESSFTGELYAVNKGEYGARLYASTIVANGEGWMIVLNVGNNTVFSRLVWLADTDTSTPLERKLESIAGDIGKFGLISAMLTFSILITKLLYSRFMEYQYYLKQYEKYGNMTIYTMSNATSTNSSLYNSTEIIEPSAIWDDIYKEVFVIFLTCVAIIVVVIPEGLPLAVTLALSFAVGRMMKENNLVRRLHACETMGNANYIICDKTGTMTTAEFKINEVYNNHTKLNFTNAVGKPKKLFDEKYYNQFKDTIIPQLDVHDKTDKSISDFFYTLGEETGLLIEKAKKDIYRRYAMNPNDRSKMTIIRVTNDLYRILKMGAPLFLLRNCSHYMDSSGRLHHLNQDTLKKFTHNEEESNSNGFRTISFVYKDISAWELDNIKDRQDDQVFEVEREGFTFIGWVGLSDTIKPEIAKTMDVCREAGVNVLIVTGDSLHNALSCGKQCNLIRPNDDYKILEGAKFYSEILVYCANCKSEGHFCDCGKKRITKIKDLKKFKQITDGVKIFARFDPNSKGILALGLKQLNNTVAVLGDGTNDVAAFKQGDVAFAMGRRGTEKCKEAADIIILDDNLASIVSSIKWGRNIYDNIRKFIQFQLSVNLSAVLLIFISSCIGSESPISAIQMLWINLIMDSLGSLSLSTEQPTDELLKRKPSGKTESIISSRMWKHIIGQSIFQFTLIFTLYLYAPMFIVEHNQDRIGTAKQIEHCFGIFPGQKISYEKHQSLYYILDGKKSSWDPLRLMLPNLDKEYCIFSDEIYHIDNLYDVYKWYNKVYGNTVHMTIIFNSFVLYALFNQINSRILDDSFNIFKRIHKSLLFIFITTSEFAIQYLIIQYGGTIFKCSIGGLTQEQWGICVAVGSVSLVLSMFLKCFNTDRCCSGGILCCFKRRRNTELGENLVSDSQDYIDRGLSSIELQQHSA